GTAAWVLLAHPEGASSAALRGFPGTLGGLELARSLGRRVGVAEGLECPAQHVVRALVQRRKVAEALAGKARARAVIQAVHDGHVRPGDRILVAPGLVCGEAR